MRRIVNRDGEIAEAYSEAEEIPERYVQADRWRARGELERALAKEATPGRVRELADRVVPIDWARPDSHRSVADLIARHEERRRARAQSSDDGIGATA